MGDDADNTASDQVDPYLMGLGGSQRVGFHAEGQVLPLTHCLKGATSLLCGGHSITPDTMVHYPGSQG